MTAPPDLDRAIREVVFGYPVKRCPIHHQWACCGNRIPSYSTSITDAFTVIERMRELGFHIFELGVYRGKWQAKFESENHRGASSGYKTTAPIAICEAAMLACRRGAGR